MHITLTAPGKGWDGMHLRVEHLRRNGVGVTRLVRVLLSGERVGTERHRLHDRAHRFGREGVV